ncbi:CBS domain-containing protein [Streptomyces platensis subsp. clarensis]|uniref:CBS domain-containing protein n=1 Tax=Streptomyces TaxID=1883 RepID=UPI00143E14CF|nr:MULTISPECIES: CBS domain-containing protein [Streptomyces]MCW7986964.1 CBS domain-containing protein [Streptomyces platensis subsp. clarensis]MCX4637773.1 CBS domain-containing protein [Streptomyces platensis]QIY53571.1 CBS domain-containing protein [Streptomyces sp. RPA4-5]WJY36098.1 CBS domain-containing protein [Streptomyces sp. P9-2B-2]
MLNTPHIVRDVMTKTVAAVDREERFKEIVETMERWKVSALPVLAGEGRVVGVVSEADLLPKEGFREADPGRLEQLRRVDDVRRAEAVTAGELMTSPALTVRAEATLSQAARTMARESVKRLPVVDGHGLLQGIVSRADLLKVFLRSDEDLAEDVRRNILGELFAAPAKDLQVTVVDGVVTLSGRVRDTSLMPVAARLVRAVEGVVDVEFDVTGPDPARTAPPSVDRRI